MRKYIYMLVLAVFAVIPAVAEDAGGRDIVVMTYNIHAGSDASIDTLAAIIRDCGADFVALQEVDVFTQRRNAPLHNGRNMMADLASATGMFPLYGRTLDFAGGYYGIGLLSRYPCVGSEVVMLPNPGGYEPRALVEGRFRIDNDHTVIFASTHICVEDTVTRALQAQFIADRYADADVPVIIGGDFNSVPVSKAVTVMESVFSNVSGTAPTFPSGEPAKKLDYIFVNAAAPVEILSTEVVDNRPWASDHRPVLTHLRLP